jgi:tRNA pseudouridine38-40 synthase
MRVAVKFAYNGKKFHGYARQPQIKTIEGEILKTLIKYGCIKDIENSRFRSASRTDKGVSALGNVVAFNTTTTTNHIIDILNNNLSEMFFFGFKLVESDFYPRFARYRIYRYYLKNVNLDIDKVITGVGEFTGTHNFRNFAKIEIGKNPMRTINNVVITNQDSYFILDFYAQTFLWHQIRRIVSALQKLGTDRIKRKLINEALHNPEFTVDFGLAPAEPLMLKDVVYDFDFEYDTKLLDMLADFEKDIVSSL